jgi:hypothetical protein
MVSSFLCSHFYFMSCGCLFSGFLAHVLLQLLKGFRRDVSDLSRVSVVSQVACEFPGHVPLTCR